MRATVLVRLGVRGLLVHRLRSSLSVVGVVFGVGAITAMSSVGEGARRQALEQIGQLGIDSVTVRAREPGLRLTDAVGIERVVPGVVAVAPLREASVQAESASRRTDVVAVGTTPAYRNAARLPLASGRFLTEIDVADAKRVAVLGASVAAALFPMGDWRGGEVLLGGESFRVVGILEGRAPARGRATPIRTRDVNRAVFVPLATLDRGRDARPDGIDEIVLRVEDAERVVAVADAARSLVHRASGTPIDVIVPREILRQRERTQRIFNVVTGAMAAISLLVSGIGIMNIMLASVAERTREVGIRRAVGATRRDVAAQFLVEASLMTIVGGAIGAGLGVLGSVAIERLAEWPTAVSPVMLAAALATALVVGIGFGAYPAWRAAHLEPMDALRSE